MGDKKSFHHLTTKHAVGSEQETLPRQQGNETSGHVVAKWGPYQPVF